MSIYKHFIVYICISNGIMPRGRLSTSFSKGYIPCISKAATSIKAELRRLICDFQSSLARTWGIKTHTKLFIRLRCSSERNWVHAAMLSCLPACLASRLLTTKNYNSILYIAWFWPKVNYFSHRRLHTGCEKLISGRYCACYWSRTFG